VVIDPSGRTALSGAEDGSVVAWDLSGKQRLGRTFRWNAPNAGCSTTPCNVINPQSTLMATDQAGGTVALVDLRALRLIDMLPARNGSVANALAFLPDGRTLVTGGINGHVTLWDTGSRSVVRTLRFPDPVWWVAVSPDGKLLAAQTQAKDSPNSRVQVQDLATGTVLYTHDVENGYGGLYFSPDGRALAALGCCQPGSSIEVWDARSGKELFTPRVEGHATAIAFSPDGRLLGAGTEDGQVVLWDAHDGSQLGSPIQVATGVVTPISFSPDGRLLAVGGGDQRTTLWDLRSRKRLGNSFPIVRGAAPAPLFEANGDLFIDYLSDAAQWATDLQTWERFACQVAGRDLTRADWNDVLPDRPYRHVCPQ
jgi:WD40 repeat protein